jgi:predicted nucleotidyltransferase
MYSHHMDAIKAATEKLRAQDDVLGVIVGGSVAYGYAIEDSDIDIMIVYSDEEYEKRLKTGDIVYFETDSTHYEGGFIDGKATSAGFIKKVAEYGSEPAKFAFKNAIVTFDRAGGLEELVSAASRYPVARKAENIEKFYSQFQTWRWYFYEALKRGNRYLIDVSVMNYVLYAGRLILVFNETLYPYHKWFLRELDGVKHKPDGLLLCINATIEQKKPEHVEKLYNLISEFTQWPNEKPWSVRFMLDSELGWLSGNIPVSDL